MVYQDLTFKGKNEDEIQLGQQPAMPIASPQGASGGQSGGQSSSPSSKQRSTEKFTNIQKYIDANKPGATQLGEGIKENIGREAQNVREGIQQSQQQFQKQAGQTQQTLDKATGYAQQVGQVGGAQQIADVQPEFETFRNIYTGEVNAPEQTIQERQNEVDRLNALTNLAGTESGRYDLLGRTFTRPTSDYSVGEKNFDQLLLQATPGTTRDLQDFSMTQQKDVGNLYGTTEEKQLAEQGRLGTVAQERQKLLQESLGEFDAEALRKQQDEIRRLQTEEGYTPQFEESLGTGALGNIYGELTNAQRNAIIKQQEDLEKARTGLREYDPTGTLDPNAPGAQVVNPRYLSQEELDILNLDPNLRTYGMDLNPFVDTLRISDTDVTMADIANQEQQARLNALYRLAGNDPSAINLGEQEGRLGAEFGQDFMGARQATEDKWIRDNINKLSESFLYNPAHYGEGGASGAQSIGDIIRWGDLRYGNQLGEEGLGVFEDALSDLSTGLSSDDQGINYRQSLADAFRNLAEFSPEVGGGDPRPLANTIRWFDPNFEATAQALLSSEEDIVKPGPVTGVGAQTPEGTQGQVREFYDSLGGGLKGRTFTDYLQDLLEQSRVSLGGNENS